MMVIDIDVIVDNYVDKLWITFFNLVLSKSQKIELLIRPVYNHIIANWIVARCKAFLLDRKNYKTIIKCQIIAHIKVAKMMEIQVAI